MRPFKYIPMKIEVRRFCHKSDYTIGWLYIDGKLICETLEDKDRGLTQNMSLDEIKKRKVYGETAIPMGTYNVIISNSPKFKRNLPRLLNVPGFDGILIHEGNVADHTKGCILVGQNRIKGQLINSKKYAKIVTDLIAKAYEKNEKITITINSCE